MKRFPTAEGDPTSTHARGGKAFDCATMPLIPLPPLVTGSRGRDGEMAVTTGPLHPAGEAWAGVMSTVVGLAGIRKTSLAVQADMPNESNAGTRAGPVQSNEDGACER